MISNGQACYEALNAPITVSHFAGEKARAIFKLVEHCWRETQSVDLALLHSYLLETGAAHLTGWDELKELMEYVPTWLEIRKYIPRLEELRVRRAKRIAIAQAAQAIEKGDDDQADKHLATAGELKAKRKPQKSIEHQMEDLNDFLTGKSGAPLVTGWPSIDKRLKFTRGRLYALAARTKGGQNDPSCPAGARDGQARLPGARLLRGDVPDGLQSVAAADHVRSATGTWMPQRVG